MSIAAVPLVFPPRNAAHRDGEPAGDQAIDSSYPSRSWPGGRYPLPMQRVPFVWDDKRRMEKLAALHRSTGTPNPADANRPLPQTLRPACAVTAATVREGYGTCAHRDGSGLVHGEAWEALAAGGYVWRAR